MTETVQDFQKLKTRLEIEQLAWKVAQMADLDIEQLADVLYNTNPEKALDLMRSISIMDMEHVNKYLTGEPQ